MPTLAGGPRGGAPRHPGVPLRRKFGTGAKPSQVWGKGLVGNLLDAYAATVLVDNPVSYFRLGDLSGTVATDQQGHDGAYRGTVTLGQPGLITRSSDTSVNLGGTGWLATSFSFVAGGSQTFEGWAQTSVPAATPLFGGDLSFSSPTLWFDTATQIGWYPANNLEAIWVGAWPGDNVSTHWVLTWNDTTQVAELYINGVSQGQRTVLESYTNAGNFMGGGWGRNLRCPCILDEVAVYNSILSAAQVTQHYTVGTSTTSLNPISKQTSAPLTGTLGFVGGIVRATSHSLSGALNFVGSLTKMIQRTLTVATLSFIGTLVKRTSHPLAGATLSLGGSLGRQTGRVVTGALTFVGSIPTRTIKALLVASLSFVGTIQRAIARGFTGGLSFIGTLVRRTARLLTGGLSFAGVIQRMTNRVVGGTLTFGGTISRVTARGLTGGLSFVGNVIKSTRRLVGATLSFGGNVVKQIRRSVTGTLSFVGSVFKARPFLLPAAVLSFSGSVTKQPQKALTAILSFAGSIQRQVQRGLAGALALTGSMTRATRRVLTATLSFVGSITRGVSHILSASLGFAGNLTRSITRVLTSSALGFAGVFAKQTNKVLSGSLSFAGGLSRAIMAVLTGTLTFLGSLESLLHHVLVKIFTASLDFGGTVTKQTKRSLPASLSLIGHFVKGRFFSTIFSAQLSFQGKIVRRNLTRVFNAVLHPVGTLVRTYNPPKPAPPQHPGPGVKSLRRIPVRTPGREFIAGVISTYGAGIKIKNASGKDKDRG